MGGPWVRRAAPVRPLAAAPTKDRADRPDAEQGRDARAENASASRGPAPPAGPAHRPTVSIAPVLRQCRLPSRPVGDVVTPRTRTHPGNPVRRQLAPITCPYAGGLGYRSRAAGGP